jgi:hypothetical protein
MSRGRSVLLGTAKPNWKSAGPSGVPVVVDSELGETITVISSVAGDERAALGHQAQIERERVRAQARDALARNEIACDDQRLDQVVSDVLAVRQGYATAFEELLTAGRRLNSIQFTVGAGGYKALFKAALFPFSEPTASKMRRIAHLWDKAIIPSDLLPLLPQNRTHPPRGAYRAWVKPAFDLTGVLASAGKDRRRSA